MKLYGEAMPAPNPRRVRIFLAEKGVEVPEILIGMRQGGHSLNIVNSVISLAHSLKLRVVAEGVETEDQAELLGDLGCDQLQGYLVSQPLPAGEIPGLLARLG